MGLLQGKDIHQLSGIDSIANAVFCLNFKELYTDQLLLEQAQVHLFHAPFPQRGKKRGFQCNTTTLGNVFATPSAGSNAESCKQHWTGPFCEPKCVSGFHWHNVPSHSRLDIWWEAWRDPNSAICWPAILGREKGVSHCVVVSSIWVVQLKNVLKRCKLYFRPQQS